MEHKIDFSRIAVWVFAILLLPLSLISQDSSKETLSIFVAGDAIITQNWSHFEEPDFMKLIDEIRGADVAMVNLEMLINDFKGYPQKASGGTWMSSKAEIADELAWAGFDVLGHANNHTFDFGAVGVLETLKNVSEARLGIAGSGKDLQAARAPVYFKTPQGKIALISASATYTDYGTAGRSRPDMQGRPGLNPIELQPETPAAISQETAKKLIALSIEEKIPGVNITSNRLNFMDKRIPIGEENIYSSRRVAKKSDIEANIASIKKAKQNADIVVFSIHAHTQGEWIEEFCRQAVDAGADIIFGHGPHKILGIEIYKGRPIFYSMGDMVFQNEQVDHLPADYYQKYGLGDDATPMDAHNVRYRNGTIGFPVRRTAWEGIGATVNFSGNKVSEIRLFPLDLGFGEPVPVRGRPKYADNELGKYIIDYTRKESEKYGTVIEYIAEENIGIVKFN